MYPTVVIIIVETQRSMADICELSSSTQSCGSGGSIFPATSKRQTITTGKESRYERSCTFQVEDGHQYDREKIIGTAEKSHHLLERTRRSDSIESDSV